MVNGKLLGELQTVIADYSDAERPLRLEFPDGRVVEDEIRLGEPVAHAVLLPDRAGPARRGPVGGRRSAEYLGRPLRLVEVAATAPRSTGAAAARCR